MARQVGLFCFALLFFWGGGGVVFLFLFFFFFLEREGALTDWDKCKM